jgi:hypothetical protein
MGRAMMEEKQQRGLHEPHVPARGSPPPPPVSSTSSSHSLSSAGVWVLPRSHNLSIAHYMYFVNRYLPLFLDSIYPLTTINLTNWVSCVNIYM